MRWHQLPLIPALLLLTLLGISAQEWADIPIAERRGRLIDAVRSGDRGAARYLVLAGLWNTMKETDPRVQAIAIWRDSSDMIDDIPISHIYAEILANWAVRHEAEIGKEKMRAMMLDARSLLDARPIVHPVLFVEYTWLCKDVDPIQVISQEQQSRVDSAIQTAVPPSDPLLAARWHLAIAELGGPVNETDARMQKAIQAAEQAGDDPTLIEAAQALAGLRLTRLRQEKLSELPFDIDDVLNLFKMQYLAYQRANDQIGMAQAACSTANFLNSRNDKATTGPMYALAAGHYRMAQRLAEEGRCLIAYLEVSHASVLEISDKERLERDRAMDRAIECLRASKDGAWLARAFKIKGDMAASGSPAAIDAFRESAHLFREIRDNAQCGEALISTAWATSLRATELRKAGKNDEAACLDAEELGLREQARDLLAGSPPSAIRAYNQSEAGWVRLRLHPDRHAQSLEDLLQAADTHSKCGNLDQAQRILRNTAEAWAEGGREVVARTVWLRLAELAYAQRGESDGAVWLEIAAECFAKSGIPDPPIRPLIIDLKRDETQGRAATKLKGLFLAISQATTAEATTALIEDITLALGVTSMGEGINGLYNVDKSVRISSADAEILMSGMGRSRTTTIAIADIISSLGHDRAVESLARKWSSLPRNSGEDRHAAMAVLVRIEQRRKDLAASLLPECLMTAITIDEFRVAARLLSAEALEALARRSLLNPNWEVQIHALRMLNRQPELLDPEMLAAKALDPIPVWGHRVEGLHGLILQGGPMSSKTIEHLLTTDDHVPRDLRTLAIKGAGYLGVHSAQTSLVKYLDDDTFSADAARALTHMGSSAHIERMQQWITATEGPQQNERRITALVALLCAGRLDGGHERFLRDWKSTEEFNDLYVVQALGWGCGDDAAFAFATIVGQRLLKENWYDDNENRKLVQRSASRLPLSSEQVEVIEKALGTFVPRKCFEPSTFYTRALDEKPSAPILVPLRSAKIGP
jgi:hypothetical protein